MLKFVWVIYMSENEKLHNRIAELRKEKGLTLQQVADAIGVGNNTISRYETGNREPKLETWKKLAKFFKAPVSYLQGQGWSQNEVASLLLYVLANPHEDFLELPSGTSTDGTKIFKYGYDKDYLKDADVTDFDMYQELVTELLVEREKEYRKKNNDSFETDDELEEYVEEYSAELFDKYISDEDLENIKSELIDGMDNPSIDVLPILKKILPDDFVKKVTFAGIDVLTNPSVETTNELRTMDEFIAELGSSTFSSFKQVLISHINLLSDYSFLSNINSSSGTFTTPEYVIAKQLSLELSMKDFQDTQDYLNADPYKASEKLIANSSLDANDKKILTNIITFLIGKNGDLMDEIESLSERVKELEHPGCFDKYSNRE